jgi:hypothetical protein
MEAKFYALRITHYVFRWHMQPELIALNSCWELFASLVRFESKDRIVPYLKSIGCFVRKDAIDEIQK